MDGLAKDPAFSVLTASHTDGGRGGKGGGRGGSATLAPDAFKANQSSELELDVFPVTGFGTLGGALTVLGRGVRRLCIWTLDRGRRGRRWSWCCGGEWGRYHKGWIWIGVGGK